MPGPIVEPGVGWAADDLVASRLLSVAETTGMPASTEASARESVADRAVA
jgi:hypothetical protein